MGSVWSRTEGRWRVFARRQTGLGRGYRFTLACQRHWVCLQEKWVENQDMSEQLWAIAETLVGMWSVTIGKFFLKPKETRHLVLGEESRGEGLPLWLMCGRASYRSHVWCVLWLSYTAVAIRLPKHALNKGWYADPEGIGDVTCV